MSITSESCSEGWSPFHQTLRPDSLALRSHRKKEPISFQRIKIISKVWSWKRSRDISLCLNLCQMCSVVIHSPWVTPVTLHQEAVCSYDSRIYILLHGSRIRLVFIWRIIRDEQIARSCLCCSCEGRIVLCNATVLCKNYLKV